MDLRRGLAIMAGLAGVIVALRAVEVTVTPGHLAALGAVAGGLLMVAAYRRGPMIVVAPMQ